MGCEASGEQTGTEYFEIGRGGSPTRPDDPLSADTVISEWIPLELVDDARDETSKQPELPPPQVSTASQITAPCQG